MTGTLDEPHVACMMLTCNRRPMALKAIESFRAQTYENKSLLILDTGNQPLNEAGIYRYEYKADEKYFPNVDPAPLGSLRNRAGGLILGAFPNTKLICHWDDDDWSHPNRLTEQVAYMEANPELDLIGYSDILYWDGLTRRAWRYGFPISMNLMGTSMMYKRSLFERKSFAPHERSGEDLTFCLGVRRRGISSQYGFPDSRWEPRMIARLHPGNTSGTHPDKLSGGALHPWIPLTNVATLEYCERRMAL